MAGSGIRLRPTRGGLFFLLLAAMVFVGAYNTDINLLMLICSAMLTVMLMSIVAPHWNLMRLSPRRSLPSEVYAGEPFRVHIRLRNAGWIPAFSLAAEDAIRLGKREVARPRGWLGRAHSRRETTMTYTAELPRRGVYSCDRLDVHTGFPFGLAFGRRRWQAEDELIVFPPRGRLRAGLSLRVGRTRFPIGSAARRGAGEEEFRSLREFVPGDNPRRIHWRTTARLGKPYVREMEWTRESSLLILVDTALADEGPEGGRWLDLALSFAAETARRAILEGGLVRFAAYGPELIVVDRLLEAQRLRGLLTTMARIRPAPDRPVADLVDEPEVGFHGAGGRLAVCLDTDAEAALRRRAGAEAVDTFVVGSPTFRNVFELTHAAFVEDGFRSRTPEPEAAAKGDPA